MVKKMGKIKVSSSKLCVIEASALCGKEEVDVEIQLRH